MDERDCQIDQIDALHQEWEIYFLWAEPSWHFFRRYSSPSKWNFSISTNKTLTVFSDHPDLKCIKDI